MDVVVRCGKYEEETCSITLQSVTSVSLCPWAVTSGDSQYPRLPLESKTGRLEGSELGISLSPGRLGSGKVSPEDRWRKEHAGHISG